MMNGAEGAPDAGGDGGAAAGPVGAPPAELLAAADALLQDDPPIIEPDSLLLEPDEEILRVATSRIARAVAFRAPFETRWNNAWLDWMLFLRGDAKAWQYRVKIPVVYSHVSAAIPNFVAAIFDSGYLFDVRGRDPSSDKRARVVRDTLEHNLRVLSPCERQAADWVKYSVLFGTGVMRASWLQRRGTRRVRETVKVPMPDGQEMVAGTRVVNQMDALLDNRPMLTCVDLWNFFPAETMDDDYNLPWAFERVESSIEQMRHDAAAGLFGKDGVTRVEEWLTTKPEQQGDVTAWANANSRASAWGQTNISSPFAAEGSVDERGDRKHAQVVYWLMVANDYRIVISGDGRKVLGKMPNPYDHGLVNYVIDTFERIPKCPFGRGAGEVLEAIQRQIDFNYAKGNDAAQLALNKPMKLRSAGNANVTTVWQPGVIVRLRDTADMEPLDVKNPMGEVSAMNAELLGYADKATGLNDLARGSAIPGVQTATESSAVQAAFRMRMAGHARELKVSMQRLGLMVLSMIQQFTDETTAIRVSGGQGLDWEQGATWEDVEPEDLAGRFDVFSTVSFSKSNPALIRQDLLAAAPIVLPDPMVNHRNFLLEFFKGFGFDQPERFVMPEPAPLRDPSLEQKALDMGIDVDPSPLEATTGAIQQHLATHLVKLQEYMQQPYANAKGLAATQRHVEKTMMMGQVLQQQGAAAPGGGPPEKPKGGGPERREATRLGQAQGSDGPPGRSPGPSAPGRPVEQPEGGE